MKFKLNESFNSNLIDKFFKDSSWIDEIRDRLQYLNQEDLKIEYNEDPIVKLIIDNAHKHSPEDNDYEGIVRDFINFTEEFMFYINDEDEDSFEDLIKENPFMETFFKIYDEEWPEWNTIKENINEAKNPYFTPYGYRDAAKVLNKTAPEYYWHLKEIEMGTGDGIKLANYALKKGLPVMVDPNDDPDYPTFYLEDGSSVYHWDDYFYPYETSHYNKADLIPYTKGMFNKNESLNEEFKKEIYISDGDEECPYLVGSSNSNIDISNRYDLNQEELWATGWIASVQNIEDAPFNSFDDIELYCYDQEKNNEYDLPSIDDSIKTQFVDKVNKWVADNSSHIEESLNENIQYGVHQFSTNSIIFRGSEEECGRYIDERPDLWDDAEVYTMNTDDPHYLEEAIDDKIELEYDNLKFTQVGKQRDVDDWDEWDRETDWTFEVDKNDLYTFIFEECITEEDYPRAFEDDYDPNNEANWKEFTDWLDTNFDDIFDKCKDKILDKYEEDAIEDAELNYDPADYIDWDSMPGGHDDYDLDEDFTYSFTSSRDVREDDWRKAIRAAYDIIPGFIDKLLRNNFKLHGVHTKEIDELSEHSLRRIYEAIRRTFIENGDRYLSRLSPEIKELFQIYEWVSSVESLGFEHSNYGGSHWYKSYNGYTIEVRDHFYANPVIVCVYKGEHKRSHHLIRSMRFYRVRSKQEMFDAIKKIEKEIDEPIKGDTMKFEIMNESKEGNICCICKEPYEGYGNNAEPVCSGRCCDKCNIERVIPMRFKIINESKELNEVKELNGTYDNSSDDYLEESLNNPSPKMFKRICKSKDAKLCDEACQIMFDWYSNEDAFDDFDTISDFIDFVSTDIYDMIDAASSEQEKDTVLAALNPSEGSDRDRGLRKYLSSRNITESKELNEDIEDYKLTYYLATATAERRPETIEDVENDWQEEVFAADSDYDACRHAFSIIHDIAEEDVDDYLADYDIKDVKEFVDYCEEKDLGDGSAFVIKLEGPNGVIYDMGYDKQSYIDEFVTEDSYEDNDIDESKELNENVNTLEVMLSKFNEIKPQIEEIIKSYYDEVEEQNEIWFDYPAEQDSDLFWEYEGQIKSLLIDLIETFSSDRNEAREYLDSFDDLMNIDAIQNDLKRVIDSIDHETQKYADNDEYDDNDDFSEYEESLSNSKEIRIAETLYRGNSIFEDYDDLDDED